MLNRLYYGWIIVYALAITEMVSWGVLFYAFTVLQTPMAAALGWSKSQMAGAFSLSLLVGGFTGIPFGRWLDQRGPRILMTAGSLLAALFVLAWARIDSLVSLYGVFVGLGIVSSAVLYEPAFAVAAVWFHRKRMQALTVITFGGGLASPVFVPLTEWLTRHYGWRNALFILAGILLVVTVPLHALLLRRRPEDLGVLPDGTVVEPHEAPLSLPTEAERTRFRRAAQRDAGFFWLTGAFILGIFVHYALTIPLIPNLIERGLSSDMAALSLAGLGAMQIPGRLLFAPLSLRLPRSAFSTSLYLVQALGVLCFLFVPGIAGVIGFVMLFGAGAGAATPARASLLADRYGVIAYASLSGVQNLFMNLVRAAAPLAASLLHDTFRTYHALLYLALLLLLTAGYAISRHDRHPFVTPSE